MWRSERSIKHFVLVAAVIGLAACSSDPKTMAGAERQFSRTASANSASQASRQQRSYVSEGVASWYGNPYHGRRTASGERFDMNAATAAHPSLPFGSRVNVTNLANGRSIVLRINDRGPFVKQRIIDVSRHAAEALGFIRQGTTRVRVKLLEPSAG